MSQPPYETLRIERGDDRVVEVVLNRPERRNAMSVQMFQEIERAFSEIDAGAAETGDRAVLVRGEGKGFTTGLDLQDAMAKLAPPFQGGLAGPRTELLRFIRELQRQTGAPARCRLPVVAAVHGWCIGGGLDLISACDLRFCSADARFSLREARIGIVADLGSLQRLPHVIGDAAVRELALTAKDIDAERALRLGLVSEVLDDPGALLERARAEARLIAGLPPLVVQGIKQVMDRRIQGEVDAGLEYVAVWNSAFLASEDIGEAMMATMQRRAPDYKGR